MYYKVIVENPEPLTPYLVELNTTGERVACQLVRGVWNRIESTPLFFAYEKDAVAVSKAYKCECGEWAAYLMSFDGFIFCEHCAPSYVKGAGETTMSVKTEAEKRVDKATEHLHQVVVILASIVGDECNGYENFSEDYKDTLFEVISKARILRNKL